MSDEIEINAPLLAGVIGYPIGQSRSPRLHGYWLNRYGLKGYYTPLSVRPGNLDDAFRALPKLGFRGVNVTMPHKIAALQLADTVTDRASLIGAANTMFFKPDGSIRADNTDGYGFIQNIRQSAPNWNPKLGATLVIGAGGASRAVVAALLGEGAPKIMLANRTRQRAEMMTEDFGGKVEVIDWNRTADAMEGAMTIVNATSMGMVNQPELPFSLDAAPKGALVTDLVYSPLETPFLAAARARGLQVVDGLGMLLHQGVPGFESWFGQRPEVDDDLRAHMLA